ncbi:Uncharacterised protein [Legionella steigerwaltii]|uniref:Uncharacterized protein n=1 Tax=Legionella steigerwaltii TaxID=460 RepID=A0A378LAZ4_9GAMM|nr:hypothetical protein [Legionella steigerwaltii]KTD70272.1 hypothetical protein Lstg_3274 [Legionella steigerwaltii]STY24006.1 Uncharacterised protein [Legionella steigerwaltii]
MQEKKEDAPITNEDLSYFPEIPYQKLFQRPYHWPVLMFQKFEPPVMPDFSLFNNILNLEPSRSIKALELIIADKISPEDNIEVKEVFNTIMAIRKMHSAKSVELSPTYGMPVSKIKEIFDNEVHKLIHIQKQQINPESRQQM